MTAIHPPEPGESADADWPARGWYVAVGGRRSGPHDWRTVVELAHLRALGTRDHVWHPSRPTWLPASAYAPLAPLLQIETAAASRTTPAPAPAPAVPRVPLDGEKPATGTVVLAAVWTLLVVAHVARLIADWPRVLDGVWSARLHVFTAAALALTGVWVLRRVWRDSVGGTRFAAALRIGVAAVAFGFAATLLQLAVNARDLVWIAFGQDPLAGAELHVLAGGTELELRGPLSAGIARRLADALATEPRVRVLHLNSPGGWVSEGERLAGIVAQRRLDTYSATGCYSACVLPYVAGTQRSLFREARLGFHSAHGSGIDPVFLEGLNRGARERLLAAGASPAFAEQAVGTDSATMWTPDPSRLVAEGLVHSLVDSGFAPSGEPLQEHAARAAEIRAGYAFVATATRLHPLRAERLDLTLRLRLRREAIDDDLQRAIVEFANRLEIEHLPTAPDAAAIAYGRALLDAGTKSRDESSAQCLATVGRNARDLDARSAAAVARLDAGLDALLAAPTDHDLPAVAPIHALSRAVRIAYEVDPDRARRTFDRPSPGGREACDSLLWVLDLALGLEPVEAAQFVRALRSEPVAESGATGGTTG
jgi:hypothetical protein